VNIISYTIWGDKPLYWRNIPFLVIVNDILFKGFCQVYYVHESSAGIPPFPVLEECARMGKIALVVHSDRIEDKILMLHRMKPLWDPNTDYLFPRDTDSIPTSWEARAVQVFLRSELSVHMFRGSKYHDTLMGGLSGFWRKRILSLLPRTFEDFVTACVDKNGKHSPGTDQKYFRDLLVKRLNEVVLDTPVCGATDLQWSRATRYPEEAYSAVDLSYISDDLLKKMDEDAVFPGAVMHISRSSMLSALSLGTDMAEAVVRGLGSWKGEYLSSLK